LPHALTHELLCRSTTAQKLTGEIHVKNLFPLLKRHVLKRCVALNAGIVDENVQCAEFIHYPGEHLFNLLLIRNVCVHTDRAPALRSDRFNHGLCAVFIGNVIDCNIGAGRCERLDNRLADA